MRNKFEFQFRVIMIAILMAVQVTVMALAASETEALNKGSSNASSNAPSNAPSKAATTSLYAAIESGQFVNYKYRQEDFRYAWRNRAYLDYSTHYAYSEKFYVQMGLGAFLWYNTFPKERNSDVHNLDIKRVSLFISNAEGVYTFGNSENPLAEVTMGIFPYKYNPEARNLGEYLFRSGAYPNFILGDFDFPLARLTGFKISNAYFPNWTNDLLLTMETDIQPHFDWTLSYLSKLNLGSFLELGGGVSFTNIISADKNHTSPETNKNVYVQNLHSDSAIFPGTDFKYEVITGDTGYYTFQSTKLMARATLNPQALITMSWLQKEDLKIYSELAILGWKNYPRPIPTDTVQVNSFYANRMERMPVLFGINLPTFRLLDLMSLELEWYGLKGPNSYQRRKEEGVPVPQPTDLWKIKNGTYTDADYRQDNWKWSVYTKKTLVPGCEIIAQAARDHVRHNFDSPIQLDREEALTKSNQWWWAVKIQFHQ